MGLGKAVQGSAMAIEHSIQKRGFRKWYERELLVGHSHLVLVLLCTLALIGGMEAFSSQPDGQRVLMAASVVVSAGIGLWALRRYLFLLMRAELIANQAVCSACQAYGRWTVEGHEAGDEASDRPVRLQVRCRGCGQRWLIEW